MPQQRKKEESERLRGERDQIKFIDLRGYRVVQWKIALRLHLILAQNRLAVTYTHITASKELQILLHFICVVITVSKL